MFSIFSRLREKRLNSDLSSESPEGDTAQQPSAAKNDGIIIKPGRYAAIDIGTVTARMLIADVAADGSVSDIEKCHIITNLGEKVDTTGLLTPRAMEETISAVADYFEVIASYTKNDPPCASPVVIATSALRDATNAAVFSELLGSKGISLSVISGKTEAQLSFCGASLGFEDRPVLVIDVGGGSTEIVAGIAGRGSIESHSFDIGCRRITEHFFSSDPPGTDELMAAQAHIYQQMEPFFEELVSIGFVPDVTIAVAGTATTVVSVRDHMEVYDSARVHHSSVSVEELEGVYSRLSTRTLAERESTVGLEPGRAPVIVAGLLILRTVLDLTGASEYIVSETDILQGLVLAAAAAAAKNSDTEFESKDT